MTAAIALDRQLFDGELRLRRLLQARGFDIFAGTTTREQRAESVRRILIDQGLAAVIADLGSKSKPQPLTYAQVFKQVYGMELV